MPRSKQKNSPSRKTFYITTPIYYVNDVPHIGHAYTTIAADTLARYHRLLGEDTFFLTGTDEHGQKVEQAAAKKGLDPQTHADQMAPAFKKLWEKLLISHDDFIRTTENRHKIIVQKFLLDLKKRNTLYKDSYEGWYCLPDERFWLPDQIVDQKCPDCGRTMEHISETNYFFKMSAYQKRLRQHILKNPKFIQPVSRRNEVLGFLRKPLQDLCISRPKQRLSWGVPFPFDHDYVAYVWVDALVNYISAAGYGKQANLFTKWWPAKIHLMGKDILTTHAVYWSTLLMATGLKLPKTLFAHGWWTVDGKKMSKSTGNVVDPSAMVDTYGPDAFRYFLLREVPFGQDGDFSSMAMTTRYNSDLANDLGNLFSRTLSMLEQYCGGVLPASHRNAVNAADRRLISLTRSLSGKVKKTLESFSFHQTLREIWVVIDYANRYVQQNAPWKLAKDPKKRERLETVLYHLAETLRILSLYLYAFMPGAAKRMLTQLGAPPITKKTRLSKDTRWGQMKAGARFQKGAALFPRIEKPAVSLPHIDKKKELTMETTPTSQAASTDSNRIDIDDFQKLDLRVGRIVSAEKIEGADRLLKLIVDIGSETRQVVAGIATRYSPEEITGRSVILVANLKPAVIRGVPSEGMILAAGDKQVEALATFVESVSPGTRVK